MFTAGRWIAVALICAACSAGSDADRGAAAGAPAAGATAGTTGGAPLPPSGRVTLEAGTTIRAQNLDPVPSTAYKAGDRFPARVIGHVTDAEGRVIIESGTIMQLRVVRLDAAAGATTGRVEFAGDSVMVRGKSVAIEASVAPVTHTVTVSGVVLVDRAADLTITLTKPLIATLRD